MKLSRRSVLAALPAVTLPFSAKADPGTALGMFERRTISHIRDCVFEKQPGSMVILVGEEGQNILAWGRGDWILVPVSEWICYEGRPVSEGSLAERLSATLEGAADYLTGRDRVLGDGPNQRVTDVGNCDRIFRTEQNPSVTLMSAGPAGYILNDSRHPHRYGVVVFTDRLKVLVA